MSDGAVERQSLADHIRQEHQQSVRRRRLVTILLVVLGVLACITMLVWLQLDPDAGEEKLVAPEHATDDFGFTLTPALATGSDDLGDGKVKVAVFEDFLCESCKVFHDESADFLAEQVASGDISLTYHPFTFLLTQTTDEYSQRASNAAACVADRSGVPAYAKMHDLLLEHQPAHGGAGLSDDELIEFADEAGADDVEDCVRDRTFDAWVEAALEAGIDADVSETPTVRVDGLNIVRSDGERETMPGPDELQYAIDEAL